MTGPPPFDCRETFQRVEDYVDRELTAEEMGQVREHLLRCVHCASEFAFEEFVLQRTREKLARIDLPDEVRARILAALERRRP